GGCDRSIVQPVPFLLPSADFHQELGLAPAAPFLDSRMPGTERFDEIGPALAFMPPHERLKVSRDILCQNRLSLGDTLPDPVFSLRLIPPPAWPLVFPRIKSRRPHGLGPTSREMFDRSPVKKRVIALDTGCVEGNAFGFQLSNLLDYLFLVSPP